MILLLGLEEIDLKLENGQKLFYDKSYLMSLKEDIVEFLTDQETMKNLKFAKKVMMSQEIKSNNNIEGINDDLSIIDEVIKRKYKNLDGENIRRIINLYHGYQYILDGKKINKDNLKELYSILSNGLLDEYDVSNMGYYYRTKPVYILNGNRLDKRPYMGMVQEKLDYYMDNFFEYVNSKDEKNDIDCFIKSQIMHFYFVYIHPYFDVNGRTSRTVSMWYLLNQKNYPYIIFNRAIAFSKRKYEQEIIKTRKHGDMTGFLKYMLKYVKVELEKEYLIESISKNSSQKLTNDNKQMIEYLLTLNGNVTAKDLAYIYNNYNEHKNSYKIIKEKISPLIDKNVLVVNKYTNGFINSNEHNMEIGINKECIDVDCKKIKYLKLDKYIK